MTQQGRKATGAASLLAGIRDEIRAKVSIVDVIGNHVQLKRNGKALVGLCPFHHEKTPSFHVNPQKGVYHCFGCHEGGDMFDFVMKVEGLSFPEAVAFLAERAGLSLPNAQAGQADRQRRQQMAALAQANLLAQDFFAKTLLSPAGQAARAYLAKRGVSSESIRQFGLGFAPDAWDALTRRLAEAGQLQNGIAAGLLIAKESGGAYDRFRGRIMIPLYDAFGKLVAFGGRALGNEEPKYLNSPETLLYAKRRMLYGLPQAKDAVRRHGRALVVEGYFDCIALHQAGIRYAVASCGTAFTPEHVQLIRRIAREICLCFDGDNAGRSAATRELDTLLNADMPVQVALLPEGHDPDTFVRQAGAEAFLGLLEKALPLTDYLLENALRQADLRTIDGRMQGVRAALPILRRVKSAVERDAYIQRVAARLGFSAQSLAAEVAGRRNEQTRSAAERHTNLENRNTNRDSAPSARFWPAVGQRALLERELLRSVYNNPDCAEQVARVLGEAPFQAEAYNMCFQAIVRGERGEALWNTICSALGHGFADYLQSNEVGADWRVCMKRLRLEHMREELEAMEKGLATLVDRDPAQYIMHISNSLMAFRRWRRAMQEHTFGRPQAS